VLNLGNLRDSETGEVFVPSAGNVLRLEGFGTDGRYGSKEISLWDEMLQDIGGIMLTERIAEEEMVDQGIGTLPSYATLSQNHPNPFNAETTIEYDVPSKSYASVKIYNTTGQLIRVLVDRGHEPAHYTVRWDGKDQNGHTVSTGIYLYRFECSGFSDMKKMLLIR